MKKLLLASSVLLVLSSTLLLTGCSDGTPVGFEDVPYTDESGEVADEYTEPPAGVDSDDLGIFTIELPDGLVVDCVASTYGGSDPKPNCDWSYVRSGKPSKDNGSMKSYTVKNKNRSVVCVASEYGGSDIGSSCNWADVKER
jgi:hypothetical protein